MFMISGLLFILFDTDNNITVLCKSRDSQLRNERNKSLMKADFLRNVLL